ncbi:synaptogyrin-2b [Huso huso]|uniref:Synaptogyrin n=1 Tax=Huso huso TaxID=61971 RepID=A0ABR0Z082_HUSHU
METYGASNAGGAFDFMHFAKQPQTISRVLSWVFAIIVFACITAEGYINPPGSPVQECIFGGSLDACHYGVGVGFLAFLAATAFFILDIYFPQISNANERKYIVIADLVFSGVWSFLWFVGFCFLTNKWQTVTKITVIGADSARAVITFSFFSIFTWGLLAYFALRRYLQGMGEFPQSYTDPAPDTTGSYAGYPPVGVESYQQPPFVANPDPSSEGGYQPPVY